MSETDNAVKHRLTPEGKFALLVILCEFLVFAGFLFFGQPERGLAACFSAAALLIALWMTWNRHDRPWFWIAVGVACLLQAPMIYYAPFSNHAYRGMALVPFGLFDFLLVWGCIKLGEKLMSPK